MTRQLVLTSAVSLVLLCCGTLSADAESLGVPSAVPVLSSVPATPGAAAGSTPRTTSLPPELTPVNDDSSLLLGVPRKACEALLCLSTIGSAPGECAEALAAYHAVSLFGGGPAFLAACPVVQ